ncbi:MAG: hypothetical protein EPN33_09025 [Acidobacteria bacterium]|nr:MAG: hypothetical protein EPN33_09025 [Acidobacteriota bacterium]
MRKRILAILAGAALFASVNASAATLSSQAQSVLPNSTRQIISVNYHRLADQPISQELESRVLPPGMRGLQAMLVTGGIDAATDLNRLTFATYSDGKGVGLLGIAEGNFGSLNLSKFFHKTKQNPNPPQIDGVSVYSSNGLDFFVPDPATIVFGARNAITQAIQTQQGASPLSQNEAMTNLIAGTQSSDVWSVLDAGGAQSMVRGLIGAQANQLAGKLIAKRFQGARYTISFANDVQVNLEMMTTDALSAAALATAMDADIAMRQRQEQNAAAKALLQQVQVDSAGNDAFLQISAPVSSVQALMSSDLLTAIVH